MASIPSDSLCEQCIALIEKTLHAMAGHAAHMVTDDDHFRHSIIDPTWDLMPLPIRLIGRERLGWDELFFRLRSEVLEVRGGTLHLRSNARDLISPMIGRMLTPKLSSLAQDRPNDAALERREEVTAKPSAHEPKTTSRREWLAVGIDLGTTYSVIAHLDTAGRPWTIPNAEGDLTTPSVVLFDGDTIVVGKEAVKAAALEPERIAQFVKRDMGSPVYSRAINGEHLPPEVIQSLILEKLKRDAEPKLGEIRQVVVTVPAYFNEPRRKATQDAGQLAGLEVMDIINEPTAAALAFGVQHGFLTAKGEAKQAETILVYDLGGGTFDVTLMQIDGRDYRTLATAGDVHLGGIDWDQRIVDHIAEAFKAKHHSLDPRENPAGFQRLLREAEDAKRTLSAREQVTINFEHAGHGIRVPLTRQQFEAMTADLLDRTRFTTMNLLREAGMKATDLTRLLLVGGSTRMPIVASMLEKELGFKPDRSLSVDEAVAHGAAIYAGLLLASEPSLRGMKVRNVNSHSLGVLGIEPETGRKRNKILISRNTPLPATRTSRFQTRHEDQRSVGVQVIEGGDASGNGSTPIGRCVVRDLPPGLSAGTPVEVTFRYAQNGRLAVEARLPTVGKEACLTLDRASGLSDENVASWERRLKSGLRPLGLDS